MSPRSKVAAEAQTGMIRGSCMSLRHHHGSRWWHRVQVSVCPSVPTEPQTSIQATSPASGAQTKSWRLSITKVQISPWSLCGSRAIMPVCPSPPLLSQIHLSLPAHEQLCPSLFHLSTLYSLTIMVLTCLTCGPRTGEIKKYLVEYCSFLTPPKGMARSCSCFLII